MIGEIGALPLVLRKVLEVLIYGFAAISPFWRAHGAPPVDALLVL
jgi:hypothetical protein